MGRSTLGRDYDIGRTLARLSRDVSELQRRLKRFNFILPPNGVPYDTGWINTGIVFSAGWDDYVPGGGNNHFEYRRIGPVVHYRGLVRRTGGALSAATQTMFTMPASIWPSGNVITAGMSAAAWVTGAASAGTAHTHNVISSTVMGPLPRLVFNASGSVQVTVPAQMTVNLDDWISFGAISYPVELT